MRQTRWVVWCPDCREFVSPILRHVTVADTFVVAHLLTYDDHDPEIREAPATAWRGPRWE